MGQSTTVFVLLLAFVAVAFVQGAVQYNTNYSNPPPAYGQSRSISINNNNGETPNGDNTITISCTGCVPATQTITFYASDADAQVAVRTFAITPSTVGTVTISFANSGIVADFDPIANIVFTSTPATASLVLGTSSLYIGQQRNGAKVSLNYLPLNTVTATITSPNGAIAFTPSTFTWTPTSTKDQFFSFRALKLSSFGLGEPAQVAITLSGTNAAGYANVASQNLTIAPLALQVSATTPLVYGQSALLRVGEAAGQNPVSSLTVTPTSTGGIFTPSSVTLRPTNGSLVEQFFSVDVRTTGTLVINFAYAGGDADELARWSLPTQVNLTGIALLTFDSGVVFDSSVYNPNEWRYGRAELSDAPRADVVVTPSSPVLVFEPSTFAFSAAKSFVNYRYKAISIPTTTQDVMFTITGTDAANVVPIANQTIAAARFAQSTVLVPSTAVTLIPGQTSTTFTIGLTVAPTTGLTVIVNVSDAAQANKYTVTPSSFTFTSSSALGATFTVTAATGVTAPTPLQIRYYLAGADASNYVLDNSGFNIGTTTNYEIVVPDISGQVITTGERQGPFAVHVRAIPTTSFSILLESILVSEVGAAIIFEPAVLQFSPSVWTATFYVVGGQSVPSIYGFAAPVRYTIQSAAEAQLYSISGATSFEMDARGNSLQLFPYSTGTYNLNLGETSDTFYLYLRNAPISAASAVSVSLAIDGFTVTPSTLTWGVGENIKSFTVTAGSLPVESGSNLRIVQTNDGRNTVGYDGLSTTFSLEFVVGVDAEEGTYGISNSPLVKLTEVGVPSEPIAISRFGIYPAVSINLQAPGLTFNPSTVVFAAGETVKYFTYTAATPLLSATRVLFRVSGAGASSYNDWESDIAAPTLDGISDININFISSAPVIFPGSVNYGYARISVPTANDVTVTPTASQGSGITFSPATFTFSGLTTVIPFEIRSTGATDSIDSMGPGGPTDIGTTVFFSISGTDAALYNPINPYKLATVVGLHAGFDSTSSSAVVDVWEHNAIELSGFLTSPATIVFWSTDPAVEIKPTSIVVQPESRIIDTFDVAYRASAPGLYQIYVNVSGVPQSALFGALAYTNFAILQVTKASVDIDIGSFSGVVEIGKAYPLQFAVSHEVGSVVVSPTDASGNIVFEPATLALSPGTPSGIIMATATKIIGGNIIYEIDITGDDVFDLADDSSRYYTISAVTGHDGPTCSVSSHNVNFGQSYTGFIKCEIPHVEDSITITPTAPFVTFSPASVTVLPGTKLVYFDMTSSPSVKATYIAAAVLGGDVEVPVVVAFSGPDFENVIDPAEDTIFSDDITLTLRTISSNVVSNAEFWGNTVSITYTVSTPVATNLVLTPTAQVAGLVFEPASITLSPGVSSAAFSLYLDPVVLYNINPVDPVWSFQYTVAVTGGDADATSCGSNCVGSFTVTPRTVTIPNPPAVSGYNIKSADWTITLPVAAPSGLTLKPVSANSEIEFTPAAGFVFAAGEITKTVTYKVKSDANGEYKYPSTQVDLAIGGADRLFFGLDTFESYTLSFTSADGQYAVVASLSSSSVKFGQPFTIQLRLTATKANIDVTEVVVTPSVNGGSFTPAFVTLSAAQPFATVTGIVANLSSALNIFGAGSQEDKQIFYAISGADAIKFSPVAASTISVYRYEIAVAAAPVGNLLAGRKYGPYTITVPSTARIVDSLTVSLNGPQGFEFTPAASFVLGENNRNVVFWVEASVPYSASAQITLAAEGPAADYFTFENKAWWVGGVDKRTITPPAITSVSTRATFYSFSFLQPIAEELTITPAGDNLVFEPAVIALAAGQTSAAFSVRTTGVSNTVITYTLGGSDALYYSPLTASPVSVDLSGYSLALDVYQVGRVGTINIYAGSNAPRSYVTVVPHSKYTTFTPSVINITAGLEDIFFSFEITGNKADYVWFTYEGPDAALFARSPLAPFVLSVQRASIGYSPAAFWTTAFKVGVPSAGVATLNPIALPAAGQTVTFTPVSAALEFSPATWTFDAETSQVAFTATAKYAAATASVFFTVDDDENFNVPAVQTISASAVGFVSSAAPSDVFPATIAPGTTTRKTITLDAPIDVIITPVIVGPITVSPAVWDFTNTQSIVVTVTAGNNMGVYSRNAYVSFSASGADVASLNTASLAPKAIAVSSSQTISIPTDPIALVPGQVVTKVVKFSDAAVIPQGEVTVLMKTTGGVVVTPASVVLDKDNQWASFTITLDDGAASVVNNPQILFYAEWAGEDRHYAVGTNGDFGKVAISVTLASFTLPTFTSAETWTVGARVGPFTASIPYAAIADVTLTPSAKGLTFDPAVLTFSENDMFVDFYVTATELQSAASVWWTVGGSDAYAYQQPSPVTISVVYNYFNLGSWSTYLGANNLLAGVASSPLNVHLQYPLEDPQATVTFTPVAAGLTFAPASFEFSNTAQSAVFTITAHNGIIGSSVISFTVDIDGDAQIATPVPLTATVSGVTSALQAITTTTTSIAYTIGSRQSYSVALKLPTPATSQLTVHASAPGVVFTDAVFAVGSTSALMSIVSAERAFSGNVVFTVSGTDASDYSVPNAISIVVTGKQFIFSSAFDALFVGVTSKKYTISAKGAANGGAPSDSVTVTPWAAGVVFTPASFVFSSTTTSVDFTISVAAGAVSDNRVVHYTISGPSAAEYAVIAPGSITVSTWTLSLSTTAISAPAGIPSSAVAVSLAASQPALTGEITVTPSAFGVVFTPASVTISGDKSSATFTATPTYITAAAVPVTFAITSAGDLAKYVAAPTATVNAVMRQMTTPADLGLNYVGVTSSSFVVSVDYLPVVAGNQVIVTPQAAGATFTPASFTFTSTSLPYATFTFSTSIVGATPTTDIAVNFLLTGSDAQFYAATASKYQSDLRPVAIVAGTSKITAGESTFVEFSTFHVPATGLTLSLSGGLTYTPASVTLSPTQTSARIEVSGGAPGLTYTNFYTLSGADASSYKLTTTSFNLQVTKYTFDHNLVTGLFTNRIGQTSAPFTIRINGGYAGQSVTLIPSAKHLVFTPSVFTFDANTQALTGTFTVTTPALQTAGVQTTVSWAVAGPAAAWFTAPASSTFTLATVATPLYSLTVPTGTITAYIGVESSSFRVYAPSVLADGKSITITPYVSGAPGVEFSPASATLTGDSLNAVFTVTTGFVGSATIEFQVSGSGANLFNTRYSVALQSNVRPLTIGAPTTYTTEPSSGNKFFVFQKSTEYIVSLAHAPATGVTLTIGNPTGGLTVTPSTITFAAGQLTASYYFVGKTYNVGTPERLTFTLSGPDAQYYAASITDVYIWMKQLSLDFTVGYLPEFRADYGVSNNYATLTGGVLPSDITIDLSATAGFEVTPSTVTIPAGAAHSEFFNIFGVENGKANGFVYIQVSGAQAGAVALLTTSLTVGTSTATYAFGGDFNSNMGTAVGEVQSVYVILSEPTLTQLTFRCESALFDIEDLVVPVGHTSATANAVATLVGATAVSCSLIGNSKFVLSGSYLWTNIIVNGGYFSRISTGSYYTGVGGWSAPVDFGLFSGRAASMATPNSLNVSFIVSPAGAAIIDPPALYIQYPASSFSFRVSPQMVGDIVVTPVLSGVDAELYSSLNAESEFVNTVVITGNKRSITVMTGSLGVVDRAADFLWEDASNPVNYKTRLIVGQESKPVTVFVGAAPTDLAIVLEAPGIVFNPSVLRFTGTYESLSFTMTATEAYGETATYVKFVMTGKDAALFNGIDTQPVYTHHKFDIPDFPILTINQPQTMSITLSSNFSAPVLLTPTFAGVVFYPEVLLFTPDKPTATFTVLGAKATSSATILGSNYNSIRLNGAQTAATGASGFTRGITPTQAIQFSWRYMSDDQSVQHLLPFLNGAKSINVLPAGFVVSFPHLQIGQTSTLTITATVAPRSDVVLTLVGNNLNFNPPNLLFTSSNPVATTAVTPVHADYQASQNIPFTVDYIISGTNQADFIPPAQSFLAVSRGTAPQADSMVLSAASPAAFASVFLLVASLIALLL